LGAALLISRNNMTKFNTIRYLADQYYRVANFPTQGDLDYIKKTFGISSPEELKNKVLELSAPYLIKDEVESNLDLLADCDDQSGDFF
jgi:hypothetical protein